MAENLYSKYRPITFGEVFGHKTIIKEFVKRAKEDSFNQAILLSSFSGCGKTTIANIIAKTLLCGHKDEEGNPCNDCEDCKSVIFEQNTFSYKMLNASNIGIDEMRNIEEFADTETFSQNGRKVIVIDELQEISGSKAQKNILKILEKKYKDVYFILLTMNEGKIDTAIKNRCVPYRLKNLTVEEIAEYLCSVCDREAININTKEKADVLITIAENSYGSMRTAMSYLERVIYSEIWNKDEVIKELNLISAEELSSILNLLLSGDSSFLSINFEKEMLDRIKYLFILMYKSINGIKLNSYESAQISKMKKVNSDILKFSLSEIYELNKFSYLTKDLIEFTLINICNFAKGIITVKTETIKRRV